MQLDDHEPGSWTYGRKQVCFRTDGHISSCLREKRITRFLMCTLTWRVAETKSPDVAGDMAVSHYDGNFPDFCSFRRYAGVALVVLNGSYGESLMQHAAAFYTIFCNLRIHPSKSDQLDGLILDHSNWDGPDLKICPRPEAVPLR
ncbi:hypothetical protein EVAR_50926_1 [Eumeta japonica]|uniref:Uncharacterized protein n=1 Tax=Eumeta variegata TaxID=151549 RepID=A0A4C1Y6P7_EUMVA|nr:hypothetical protein EVAR_50926_1 [Eumeta japonica]